MENIRKAIEVGTLEEVKLSSRMFLSDFESYQSFSRIPLPGPDDWLSCQCEMNFQIMKYLLKLHSIIILDERGQTFKEFRRNRLCVKPQGTNKTIYVQPIGNFSSKKIVPLEVIREFLSCFFNTLETTVLPIHTLQQANSYHTIETRPLRGSRRKITQLKTGSVISYLEETKKRRRTKEQKERFVKEVVTIGITYPYDLYPNEDSNFVFGIAYIRDGIGVYSFARFIPSFPNLREEEEVEETNVNPLVLRRSLGTVAHEISHLFGLNHCIYYHCLMNGSNHQEEADAQPLFLCPVCLRKIQYRLGCDLKERYEKLSSFYQKHGMREQYEWIRRRFNEVESKEENEEEDHKMSGKKRKRKHDIITFDNDLPENQKKSKLD